MKATSKIKIYGLMLFLMLIIILANGNIMAQQGYQSHHNFTGLWDDNSTWDKSASWLADKPGTNVGGATAYIHLYGYVSTSGDLTVAGSSTLTIYDTLWVNGDLNVSGGSRVNIDPAGVLIVAGNFNVSGGTVTANTGRVVVTGNVSATGGSNITNDPSAGNAFYVYGTISRNGGATFNGSNSPANGNFVNKTGLYNNDSPLASFVGGALPVTMLWARASYSPGNVMIKWATASEINNEVFIVQRSYNGKDFYQIGRVTGAGNSTVEIEYDFEDFTKQPGVQAYYRIQQIDFDGKSEYSAVFTVEGSEVAQMIEIYPNPAADRIFIHNNRNEYSVQVFDTRGVIYLDTRFEGADLAVRELDITQFPAGVYFLRISESGTNETAQFVKQ